MTEIIITVLIIIIVVLATYYYQIKKGTINWILIIICSCVCVCMLTYIINKATPDYNDYHCITYSYYKTKSINKEAIIKKIDLLHMASQVLILKRLGENKFDTIFFDHDKSNAYNEIKTGDTLVKKGNNDSLFKLRNGELIFIHQINCGCDTAIYIKKHGSMPAKQQ